MDEPAFPITFRRVATNGVTLNVAFAGPEGGPPVLMLHGFPEFWYAWRHQIGPLAAAGYRVIVPDQRGYDLSDKPAGVAAYGKDTLAGDVLGLLDALGVAKVRLVCHDWGGIVGWWIAIQHPDRLERMVVCNIPHPAVMAKALGTVKQLRKSWYAFAFQVPWAPERVLAARRCAVLRSTMVGSANPGTFTDEELDRYVGAWEQPGALTGMVSWYRAARLPTSKPRSGPVEVPTLMIWGTKDVALGEELAEPSIARCRDGRLVKVPTAGHFVQHDAHEIVTREILGFLGSVSAGEAVASPPL